jgi:two-component system nitrogen regulation sensor histidine kinase NtrY
MIDIKSQEGRKRVFEFIAIVTCSLLLIVISRLETRLFSLGALLSINREFFSTIIYFALINLNVVLTLILGFLLFRNITKLVVERKRGVIGSALRKKLVIALIFFAIAPTLILFYVTTHFITTSFETWFSEKVQITIQKTKDAGSHIYKQDQKRLASLARLAMQRIAVLGSADLMSEKFSPVDIQTLIGFDTEYGLNAVRIYTFSGNLFWTSNKNEKILSNQVGKNYALDSIAFFQSNSIAKSHSRVSGEDARDVVNGSAPVRDPLTNQLRGVIVTEIWFETQILKSVEQILTDFEDLKPGAQLIRLSYMILLGVLVLLILFAATWLGFYVAKEITGPIQSLAEATREVALGNYDINLKVPSDDEIGQLVNSFNKMTHDLYEQKLVTERTQIHLEKMNDELEHKRQYLEIVLKHITAGVLSLDSHENITSINAAAERLLKVDSNLKGKSIKDGFGPDLYDIFWVSIRDNLFEIGAFHGQLELSKVGCEVSLLVNAIQLHDENDVKMGYVIVFEDALEKIRSQRVLAWREVARRIAHEIKNPITPIKLNAQRLVRKFKDKFQGEDQEVFRTCMETIITQVDSLRDLVNEFAKFSKMPNIKPKNGDINFVLQEVTKMFKMSYSEIDFIVKVDDKVPVFALDKEQLSRAFVNIYNNAVASLVDSRRGYITTLSRFIKELRLVRIEIADNGCGIPNELKDRVLEPYFSTKDEGTGLGLAIVHQIVSDHGGYLRLADNTPHGSIVIIELPIA